MWDFLKELWQVLCKSLRLLNTELENLNEHSKRVRDEIRKTIYEDNKAFYIKHHPHNPNPTIDEVVEFFRIEKQGKGE